VIDEAILQGSVKPQEIKGTRMEMQGIGTGKTTKGLYQWSPLMHWLYRTMLLLSKMD
nr:hypothetical protein [Tanacetum cinerariifolium]